MEEHRADNAGVSGSIPLGPIRKNRFRACSSVGRAPALHAGGQEFNSPQVHKWKNKFEIFTCKGIYNK